MLSTILNYENYTIKLRQPSLSYCRTSGLLRQSKGFRVTATGAAVVLCCVRSVGAHSQ